MKQIKDKRIDLEEEAANKLISDIEESTNDSHRMFKAVRELKLGTTRKNVIKVKNSSGSYLLSDASKANIIADWFKDKLTDPEGPLETFQIIKPLNLPISENEVTKAIKRLKLNRSTGPDGISNEMIKASGPSFIKIYTKMINMSFETGVKIENITIGDLAPLPKPNKEQCPIENLRPIILLNGMRKVLSLITLKRIENNVNQYVGPYQHGYEEGQGCEDVVWSQKILTSIVLRKGWSFSKIGIDMSRAFDTIKRGVILYLLADAGCSEDDIALVRYLLSSTKLEIKVNKTKSKEFKTSLGSGQGDSLSGKLFTLYLAGALNHLRAILDRPNPPISDESMPLEFEYVDDCDFIAEEMEELKQILPKIEQTFDEWNLKVNPTKTEYTEFYISNDPRQRGSEKWRKNKTLGSLLCSRAEIQRRVNLGNAAFSKYEKLWINGKQIDEKLKIKIYEATVVSIMLYNSGTWAAPKQILETLDASHRKHIRKILKIKWSDKISNEKLYEMSNLIPLSKRVEKARLRMLGKVLRQPENKPTMLSLTFAMKKMETLTSIRGRPVINLLDTIIKDIESRGLKLNTADDIEPLRELAKDSKAWDEFIHT